ncbi:MAG: cobalamin biosynthesis protein CobD [Oscillospiraceae bacterium]|nr:cobalamin biosynthesis protein CobD [Oscillospiraceae bacterium]
MKDLIPALPLIIGFLLDMIFGDPYSMPHPVRLIGSLIAYLEKYVRKHFQNLRFGGAVLAMIVILCSAGIPAVLLMIGYHINLILGILTESILCYYMLAARCLRDESMKVYRAFQNQDTESARKAVSMIVGRDTAVLDESGIIRAAVETVAENTSDGVTAPLFYMALGGAVGGCFYKAVNTMDSMLGYQNETYLDIGRFPAKLDDVLNFIPSRVTALLMIICCPVLKLDMKNAYRIWKRDRRKHASPNSAQTESACAGALHIRLAGNAYYFGELHKKEYIGDDDRPVKNEDIHRTNRLMYLTSVLMLIIAVISRILIFGRLL